MPHPSLIFDDKTLSSYSEGGIQINNSGIEENKANKPKPPMKTLLKERDPGKFIFPCKIADNNFFNSLGDFGSNVNAMFVITTEKLRLHGFKPSNMTLVFGDSSTEISKGIDQDPQLKIERSIVSAAFYILEMDEDMSLILGRGFLATVGAVNDFLNHMKSFKI